MSAAHYQLPIGERSIFFWLQITSLNSLNAGPDLEAKTIALCLEELISRHSVPQCGTGHMTRQRDYIVSDYGQIC
jgi:hypothetical protein